MKQWLKNIIIGSVCVFSITGCYYDVEEELYPNTKAPCDTTGPTYADKVLPVLQANCYGCHSASSALGNVNLEGFANVKTFADNGRLVGAITHSPGFSPMPKGGNKLSDCDIAGIQAWINLGSVNN